MLNVMAMLFVAVSLWGQAPAPKEIPQEVLTQLEEDVWLPFLKAYEELDVAKFKAVHTDDIVRVSNRDNTIEHGAAYMSNMERFFNRVKKSF